LKKTFKMHGEDHENTMNGMLYVFERMRGCLAVTHVQMDVAILAVWLFFSFLLQFTEEKF
jgi:hypothetical protein